MKKLNNTETELKKNVAYLKKARALRLKKLLSLNDLL